VVDGGGAAGLVRRDRGDERRLANLHCRHGGPWRPVHSADARALVELDDTCVNPRGWLRGGCNESSRKQLEAPRRHR